MKITAFAFVGHLVASLRRARKFYEEVLMSETEGHRRHTGGRSRHAGIRDRAAHAGHHHGMERRAAARTHPSRGLVVEVEDFSQAVAHLKEHGVTFEMAPFEGARCSIAVVLDPDGNRIGIHQRKAK